MQKPSIPKGTRDFSPSEIIRRNFIFDIIKSKFKKFGFSPIETPSFENLSTLTGKYGSEGEQLLFKILKRGAKFEKALEAANNNKVNDSFFSSEALRYDLTVPFARYIVQHQNDITFPFKRYQIQPVWRADRPQKGRYREFYQCDADIVGTNSLNCEIELVGLISEVLNDLNLSDHTIMINNRKILSALISLCNSKEYFSKITVIIDKIDKIGIGKVIQELRNSIPNNECAELFNELFKVSSSTSNTINWLENKFQNNEEGKKGLQELKHIIHLTKELGIDNLEFNISLARGLDYYTGSIFEVVLNNSSMGSIVGGGRYDNLTKVFGQNDLSGVGISFGAERIYDLMNDLNLFPTNLDSPPKYMIIDQSKATINGLKLLKFLRAKNIASILYPEEVKLKKQIKYAHVNKIPFVIFLNKEFSSEILVELKNMDTGVQNECRISNLT
jgi:histidyl-tRNA synthetase|tara:strand:+ start:113 stop:1447 length:1335 start_codon:yes stop_codon:yes gene_type:complete